MYKIVTKSVKPGQVDGLYSILCLAQCMSRAAAKIERLRGVSKLERLALRSGGCVIATQQDIVADYMATAKQQKRETGIDFVRIYGYCNRALYIWGIICNVKQKYVYFIPLRHIGRKYN